MNFLSHFYLLSKKHSSDLVVGNLLPDVIRGFSKLYNHHIRNKNIDYSNSFLSGIKFHIEADKLFHNSIFFKRNTFAFRNISETLDLNISKEFIVSHVLLELLIDRFIDSRDENLTKMFYTILNQSSMQHIEREVSALNIPSPKKIVDNLHNFIKKEYAYMLRTEKGVLEAMNAIIGNRIGLKFEGDKWTQAIILYQNELNQSIPSYLTELKEELEDAQK